MATRLWKQWKMLLCQSACRHSDKKRRLCALNHCYIRPTPLYALNHCYVRPAHLYALNRRYVRPTPLYALSRRYVRPVYNAN